MNIRFFLAIMALIAGYPVMGAMSDDDDNELLPSNISRLDQATLTSHVVAYIERGDLDGVRMLVPSRVRPDAKSASGRTLVAIAEFWKKPAIVQYLRDASRQEDVLSEVVNAIQSGDLVRVQGYVPSQLSPSTRLRNGYSLLSTAYRHNQYAIGRYLEDLIKQS